MVLGFAEIQMRGRTCAIRDPPRRGTDVQPRGRFASTGRPLTKWILSSSNSRLRRGMVELNVAGCAYSFCSRPS
jgi:hypothetical protein